MLEIVEAVIAIHDHAQTADLHKSSLRRKLWEQRADALAGKLFNKISNLTASTDSQAVLQ